VLTLYATLLSANGRKVFAVARQLELTFKLIETNVYRGEGNESAFRDINPWGKIPSLEDQGFCLWESNAIIVYLAERYGASHLYGHNEQQRADILRWLFWESAHWQPVLNRILAARVAQVLFKQTEQAPIDCNWRDQELSAMMQVLQSRLSQHAFITGDQISLADFSLAAMTTYFKACDFPAHDFPAFGAWLKRMDEMSSWQTSLHETWQMQT